MIYRIRSKIDKQSERFDGILLILLILSICSL
jgi:hypothetical protein